MQIFFELCRRLSSSHLRFIVVNSGPAFWTIPGMWKIKMRKKYQRLFNVHPLLKYIKYLYHSIFINISQKIVFMEYFQVVRRIPGTV